MWEKTEEQAYKKKQNQDGKAIRGFFSPREEEEKKKQKKEKDREKEEEEEKKKKSGKIFSIIMSIDAILVERTRKERQSRARASSPIEQYVTTLC